MSVLSGENILSFVSLLLSSSFVAIFKSDKLSEKLKSNKHHKKIIGCIFVSIIFIYILCKYLNKSKIKNSKNKKNIYEIDLEVESIIRSIWTSDNIISSLAIIMLICIFYNKDEKGTNLKLLSIPFLVGFVILVSNPMEILFKTNSYITILLNIMMICSLLTPIIKKITNFE